MQYHIGDSIYVDSNEVISFMIYANKSNNFLVVGIDNEDGCPCVGYQGLTLYLWEDQLIHTKLISKGNKETLSIIEKEYPYVAPNKEIDGLIIRLEYQNNKRADGLL